MPPKGGDIDQGEILDDLCNNVWPYGRCVIMFIDMYGIDSTSGMLWISPAGSTRTLVDSAASLRRLGLPFLHSFASDLFHQLVEVSAVGRASSRQHVESLCQSWQAQAESVWAMRDHGPMDKPWWAIIYIYIYAYVTEFSLVFLYFNKTCI